MYEITDAVKWAYQSAFGCGHLLPDAQVCQRRIAEEIAQTPEREIPVFETIGGGLCRLNLGNRQARKLDPALIAKMMRLTDETVRFRKDNHRLFEAFLEQARKPFENAAWESYLTQYRAMGCPPVSHSESYRRARHPAYRVVLEGFGLLVPVIASQRRVIVIDGPCGSGKTTLAGLLARLYGTEPIPMDDFFLPPPMRTQERLSIPGGNVHHERFLTEVLENLAPGRSVRYQRFDCQSLKMLARDIPPAPHVIIEGSYSHHPAFEAHLKRLNALRVYVDVEESEQLRRIARRDPELLSMFQTRWIPLEKTYFEAYDIKGRAEIVLQSGSGCETASESSSDIERKQRK